jgi:hypothetical protein
MEDARMQAISGALQIGRRYNPSIGEMGIPCFGLMITIMLARAFALLSFVVRRAVGGWEDFGSCLLQMLFLLLLLLLDR